MDVSLKWGDLGELHGTGNTVLAQITAHGFYVWLYEERQIN